MDIYSSPQIWGILAYFFFFFSTEDLT
jgi:hypothetical protein